VQNQILTIKQASRLLQVDPNTIYRWARAGKFPASKIGKEWRVLRSDVHKFIESHKIRNQFLSEAQEAELITALVGRREIPLKFEYFGEGADRYVAMSFPKEAGGESEFDIVHDNEERFKKILTRKKFNFLDLGCGDGKKAAYLMGRVLSNVSVYAPLDSSSRMLEIAESNMQLTHEDIHVEKFLDDFEQGNVANASYYLHRRYKDSNFIFFVGNTIGNISDASRVLVNIRESMREDDYLLVGLAYYNAKNIPVSSYNNRIIEYLWTVPDKIGINRNDAKIYWSYNDKKRQLECQLEFVKDWKHNFGLNLLKFSKGQRIRLAISRRFTKDEIVELFANAGFKIELLVNDKDNALVLSRPHSWERQV